MKKVLFFCLLAMLIAVPAQAKFMKSGDLVSVDTALSSNAFLGGTSVSVNEVVDGDVFAAGTNVFINAPVNGDVFLAGSNVTIDAKIDGSVYAAGSNIVINGEVTGNIRLVGSSINVSNKVGKNALLAGANIFLTETASIGRHLTIGGAEIAISSPVGGNFEATGVNLRVNSEIKGDADLIIDSSGSLLLAENGRIAGDLNYKATEEIALEQGVQVLGAINFQELEVKATKVDFNFALAYFMGLIYKLVSLYIVALILVMLMPKAIRMFHEELKSRPGNSLLWGLILLIVVPLISLAICFTIVGLPLGIIGFALYFVYMYFAKVLAGVALGKMITDAFKWKKMHLAWSALIGLAIFIGITAIPIIGWALGFLLVLGSFGALAKVKMEILKKFQ